MSDVALAVVDAEVIEKPHTLMRQATDAASACREIVLRTAMELQGKKYVRVEGWASIAAVYGCTPSIKEVVEEDRGIKAVAELRTHDGRVIATAEGFCGLDEPRWANQPLYARKGMAQTRAVSRVCRTAFAFVVTLIDGGLQTTPAEEIPQAGAAEVEAKPTPTVVPVPAPGAKVDLTALRIKDNACKFGKAKGKFLCDLEQSDLEWQRAAAARAVGANDPKWHQANERWLARIDAEVARRKS